MKLENLNPNAINSLIQQNADGIMVTDMSRKILYVNSAVVSLFGYTVKELEGSTPSIFNSGQHKPSYFEDIFQAVHIGGSWSGYITNKKKDGKLITVQSTITLISDENGNPVNYISIYKDMTIYFEKEEELRNMAFRDPLTNLYNRRYLLEELGHVIANFNRHKNPFSVILLDLDDFSAINNTWGHNVGDKLLIGITKRLSNLFKRDVDIVARFGGDEFVVLVEENTNEEDQSKMCRRIVNSMAQPHNINGVDLKATVSVGIALVTNDDYITSEEVLKRADQAMYTAKKSGKNTCSIYPID